MQPDFLDAHERHWCDAQILFRARRYANADHFYGMAAECGLKQLMVRFGMSLNQANGVPVENADRTHANKIWDRFESYRSGKMEGAGYELPSNNPFSNWDVSDRYAHQSLFDEIGVIPHQTGAEAIRALIAKARLDGLL